MTDPLDPHDQPPVPDQPAGVPDPPPYPDPAPSGVEPPPAAPAPQYPAPPPPPDPTLAQPGTVPPPPPAYQAQPGPYAPPQTPPPPQHGSYAPPAYPQPQAWYAAPPGPAPVYAPAPAQPPIKHLPWFGAAIAVIGLVLYVLSVTVLSWVDSDLSNGESFDMAEVANLAEAVNQGEFSDDLLYAEWYGEWLWIAVALYVIVMVTFSTLVVPTSKSVRTVIWCLLFGLWCFPFGVAMGLLNLADEKGTFAPRILAAVGVLGAAGAHALVWANLVAWDDGRLTGGDLGPAVWVGSLGLVVVAAGCAVGTRTVSSLREQAQAPVAWTGFPGA